MSMQYRNDDAVVEALDEMLDDGELLGAAAAAAGATGFDWSNVIDAAAEGANQAVQYKASQDAQSASAATSATSTAGAIAADANWANAEQQLDLAQQSKDAGRIQPAQALQSQAQMQAMAASSSLSADGQTKRAVAAQKAAGDAAQAALNSPKDAGKQAMSRAWQKVLMGSGTSAGAGASALAKHGGKGGMPGMSGGNWFTASHAGIPGWGWVVGGTVTATGVVLLIRALVGRRGR